MKGPRAIEGLFLIVLPPRLRPFLAHKPERLLPTLLDARTDLCCCLRASAFTPSYVHTVVVADAAVHPERWIRADVLEAELIGNGIENYCPAFPCPHFTYEGVGQIPLPGIPSALSDRAG